MVSKNSNSNRNGHTRPLKLDVLVVGAGIAGLATAIACAEKGFNVTCLEYSYKFAHVGAGLMISANASRVLVAWGLQPKLEKVATASKRTVFKKWDGSAVVTDTTHDVAGLTAELGAPNWQIHRADLHDALLAKALSVGVDISMGARVQQYDWDGPSATLEDGSVRTADVILAADGYRSRSRGEMLGGSGYAEPRASGTSAFRCVIHKDELQDDPELRELVSNEKQLTLVWIGDGKHILSYPIRQGEFYNIVSTQPEVFTATGSKYVVPIEASLFQKTYAHWDPLLVKILSKVPEEGTLEWKLADLPPMNTWLFPGEKIALVGDACHPMLPSAAQGAGMAIEDGAAVAEFLARAEDKGQIPMVLKAWERMRLPRCWAIVNMGRAHAAKWHEKDANGGVAPEYRKAWGYDVIEEAKRFPLVAA